MMTTSNPSPVATAAFRAAEFLPVDIDLQRGSDGSMILRSRVPLMRHEPVLARVLAEQAAKFENRPFILQRRGADRAWQGQSYGETKRHSDAVAQWLINRGIGGDRSVLILSGNSVAHAIIKFGAFAAGVPVCPVSVNYGMAHADFGRLIHVVSLVKPGVVFVEDAARFAKALVAVDFGDAVIVTSTPDIVGSHAVAWDDVVATPVTPAVAARLGQINADAPAAYMLTSGSTGRPKAVVQTHAMIAANIAQAVQTLGKAAGWDQAFLDWLPWSHVSGAAAPLMALTSGGTLHIDDGRPLPGAFEESLRNLREIPPRYYVNVPMGYAMLADALEADADLRRTFFRDLQVMLYGGAGLPQPVLDRIQAMAVATVGHRIIGISAYGATETTSGCLAIHYPAEKVGIGLPMPGIEVKLIPYEQRYEIRIRGPIITPGYLNEPEKSREIFDGDGFYRTGDYAAFVDDRDPLKGLVFAGRLAEEFKLGSGTWVRSGELRADLMKRLSPYVSDLVICAEGRGYLALLVWLNRTALDAESVTESAARTILADRLKAHNTALPGLSTRIRRCLILAEPPVVEAHEISDKGSINRSIVLARRADAVAALYGEPPGSDVIVVD
ncbi:MAG: AMP-binding protein [Rhodospirillaceae bacterium]|nr:AMP-binding protein [Rhodospirillaceae bacterium]